MYKRIAHYKISKKLGEGAMGSVYEGLDESLAMKVAIKVLSPAIVSDEENLARFEREARAAANLKHPNIAHVFFIGRTEDDLPFYAMEYIDGRALGDLVHDRMVVKGQDLLDIMIQTASALKFASDNGILHRDVKPGNIMIEESGNTKLVDFGLAKVQESDSSLTRTGFALGTPNYISPEQAKGESADLRSDMYSLGVTFFELLSGAVPYQAENPMGVLMKHVQEPVPNLRAGNPDLPEELAQLVERMMAKSPADRFRDYDELLERLGRIATVSPEFAVSEWSYCENCAVVSRVGAEQQCSRCQQRFEPPEKEVVFYSVHLNGFSEPQAMERVADYMVRTTTKPRATILQLLKKTPVILATRIEQEKAKQFRNRLFAMGAVIELKQSAVKKERPETSRPTLTINRSFGGHVEHDAGRVRPKPEKSSNGHSRRWMLGALAGAVVLLAVIVWAALGGPTPGSKPAENVPVAKTAAAEAKAPEAVEPESDAAELTLVEFKTADGLLHLRSRGWGDAAVLEKLAGQCESDLSRIGMLIGHFPSRQSRIDFDGARAFAPAVRSFGMLTASTRGRMTVPVGGIEPDDPRLRPMLVAMMARCILKGWGEHALPAWMERGFGLYVMAQLHPGVYEFEPKLGKLPQKPDPELWLESIDEGGGASLAQATSLVGFLIENYQMSGLRLAAGNIAAGEKPNQALQQAFGGDLGNLLEAWSANHR